MALTSSDATVSPVAGIFATAGTPHAYMLLTTLDGDNQESFVVASKDAVAGTITACFMKPHAAGTVVVCDRYLASSIAYGEAQDVDGAWLREIQRFLPPADLTILLDIAPETAAHRKSSNRDKFERDLALLSRVRDSYLRQAAAGGWLRLDGARPKEVVAADVLKAVAPVL